MENGSGRSFYLEVKGVIEVREVKANSLTTEVQQKDYWL